MDKNTIIYFYDIGAYDVIDLHDFVELGYLTPDEYEHITGLEYM